MVSEVRKSYLPKAPFDGIYFKCTRCGGRVMNLLEEQYRTHYRNLLNEDDTAACINCGSAYQRCILPTKIS